GVTPLRPAGRVRRREGTRTHCDRRAAGHEAPATRRPSRGRESVARDPPEPRRTEPGGTAMTFAAITSAVPLSPTATDATAIDVCGVSKSFGTTPVLRDVSVAIASGSLTALLGPTGGGKATLLRAIAGLESPDSGSIVIAGVDATRLAPQRRNVGFVFQHYAAFKHMTVRGNVGFGLEVRKRPKAEIRRRVDELLELV